MQRLASYYDSDSEDDNGQARDVSQVHDSAPVVRTETLLGVDHYADAAKKVLLHNLPYENLTRPVQTVANPYERTVDKIKNSVNGLVESFAMPDAEFETQRRTYKNYGYAVRPSLQGVYSASDLEFTGDLQKAIQYKGATVDNDLPVQETLERLKNKKRLPKGDPSRVDGWMGPWAGFEGEIRDVPLVTPSEEEIAKVQASVEDMVRARAVKKEAGHETTIFHLKEDRDYLKRTYVDIPQDLGVDLTRDPADHDCFPPKKLVHTWTGHIKGVNAIRFFPVSGHLILSASMDARIKIWDVMKHRECIRDYIGHEKAVRDITFTNDGRKFLSASHDRTVKLWDTETGQCISRFAQSATPYCVKFNPDADKQNIFLAGCGDNKIVQWDINSGESIQSYDQHTRSINTITFIDRNRRFVSTSDDKSIRVWDYDIPVPIKYIAEPHMHAVPSVCQHPSGKFVAMQSMDNQILVYSVQEQFRLHRKKRYAGHMVAGFACQVNFSPDGKFICSGDARGGLFVWDWGTGRIVRKMGRAHQQVTIGVEWHPQEPSKIATCSWDGTIKLWD